MGRRRHGGTALSQWSRRAAMVTLFLAAMAGPAAGQDDPYRDPPPQPAEARSVPAGAAAQGNFAFLVTSLVEPGGVNDVYVDAGGAPNVAGIVIRGCGNADSAGNPLPTLGFFDPANCWRGIDGVEDGGPGEIAGTTFLVPFPLPTFETYGYRWDEPIGTNGATCVTNGNYSCSIIVERLAFPGPAVIDSMILPVQARPEPQLLVSGPPDPSEGDIVSFAFTGFDTPVAAKGIGMCGNGDALGQPLPVSVEHDPWTRCSLTPTAFLQPGEPLQVTEGSAAFFSDGTDSYLGTYVWHDTFPTVFGPTVTCIDDGNFECVLGVFDPNLQTIFEPTYSSGSGPSVRLGIAEVVEGDGGWRRVEVPITLSAPAQVSVFAGWRLVPGEADQTDVVASSGFITFAPGETAGTIPIDVIGDEFDEHDEFALLSLTGVINGKVGGFYGLGGVQIIEDPDPPPVLVAGLGSGFEGQSGTTDIWVPIRYDYTPQKEMRFQIDTASSTATQGVDFQPRSTQIVIGAGWPSPQAVWIRAIGDEEIEPDERAVVRLSAPVNASIGGFYGLGFADILNDDSDCIPGPDKYLGFCDFSEQVFVGTDFSGSLLDFASFDGAVLVNSDLHGASMQNVSAVDSRFVNVNLDGAGLGQADLRESILTFTTARHAFFGSALLTDALLPGIDLTAAFLDGADFTRADLLGADLSGATFGFSLWNDTVCPDGTNSDDNGFTCHRLPLHVLRWVNGDLRDEPVVISDPLVAAVFDGADPGFDPTLLYGWSATFGRTGVEAYPERWFFQDVVGDSTVDFVAIFAVELTGLEVGERQACMRGQLIYEGAVYGCTTVTVNTAPPVSPPASPPTSPPTSPPVSGLGGVLANLVPLLQGPVGLMATAAALGLVFLLGSTRTAATLEPRRDDPDDEAQT